MIEHIEKAAAAIREKIGDFTPDIAIVLGTGLGPLADAIEDPIFVPYEEIPGFHVSTVVGHAGRLVVGTLEGQKVICMQGRVHYYEGVSAEKIILPIRTFKWLGAKKLFLTNAAGSLRKDMPPGSLMTLTDHINMSGFNPLIGPNDDNIGPRFPDVTYGYNPDMREALKKAAKEENVKLFEGVYVMASGPNFETPAEIRSFAIIGGDAVGMSTAPEMLIGNHCGMTVAAVSVVTNYGCGLVDNTQTHEDTLEVANQAAGNLQKLVRRYLKDF